MLGGDTNQNMSSNWTGGPPAAPPPNSILDVNQYLGPPGAPPGAPAQASDNKGGAPVTGQTFQQQQPQQPPAAQPAADNKGGMGGMT